jgi:hypothetical protein
MGRHDSLDSLSALRDAHFDETAGDRSIHRLNNPFDVGTKLGPLLSLSHPCCAAV